MKRADLLSVGLAGAATAFTEAIVGWLLPAAFGEAFAGAVAPARVLILAGFFMGMRRIYVVFLQGVGRPGRTGIGEAIALVTLLALAAVLVPLLSLMGASLALLGAAVASNVYLLLGAARPDRCLGASREPGRRRRCTRAGFAIARVTDVDTSGSVWRRKTGGRLPTSASGRPDLVGIRSSGRTTSTGQIP